MFEEALAQKESKTLEFKIGYVLLAVMALVYFIGCDAKETPLTKQEIWDSMSDDVDHWIDGVGYPMDKEIKEIVIALNVLGIETAGSCEGHLDRGCAYPWVDLKVSSPETEKLLAEMIKKHEQRDAEEKSLETKYPDLSYQAMLNRPEAEHLLALNDECLLLSASYNKAKMNCLEPLNNLLNQFYENRLVSYDSALIIPQCKIGRLQCVGADRQVMRPEEVQAFKLIEYQIEMKAFAAFLKKKFMDSN